MQTFVLDSLSIGFTILVAIVGSIATIRFGVAVVEVAIFNDWYFLKKIKIKNITKKKKKFIYCEDG